MQYTNCLYKISITRRVFALITRCGYRCRSQVPEHEILKIVRMHAPIITEFFDNEEKMAKFQKWREEYEEKERLEKAERAKKKRERLM